MIYAKKPFSKPQYVIEYLGRYTHKIAVSNHRIKRINYKNRTVTFQAKDYKKGGQKSLITLTSIEFIRRFGLHILPKGFTRIRHFGILSSSWKKIKLPALKQKLQNQKPVEIEKKPPMKHRHCPSCKKGKLITIMLFDKRGLPKVWIDKINIRNKKTLA